jgi:competence protein ComEC
MELAGVAAEPVPMAAWPGARCSSAFCVVSIERGGRDWRILLGRNRQQVEERALAAACAEADIVIADRYLPRSCRPSWLKADRRYLAAHGGLAIDLTRQNITSVAQSQGEHGWWRPAPERPRNAPLTTRNQPAMPALRPSDAPTMTR